MILVCIECGEDMEEIEIDEFRCPGCGYWVEQMSIPENLDPEEPGAAV